jgi:hypothetical protein
MAQLVLTSIQPQHTLVRFSVESSIARCTSRLLVLLLKFMLRLMLAAASSPARKLEMVTDFEVPGSPMSRQGLPEPTTVLSSQEVLQTINTA